MTDVASAHGTETEDHGHHPTDIYYIRIAVALAVITGAEVAWSYLPWWDESGGFKSVIEVGVLMIMMAVKFVVVASNFMHLKFDDKLLTRIFYFGIFLAIVVYMIVLTTMHFFSS